MHLNVPFIMYIASLIDVVLVFLFHGYNIFQGLCWHISIVSFRMKAVTRNVRQDVRLVVAECGDIIFFYCDAGEVCIVV